MRFRCFRWLILCTALGVTTCDATRSARSAASTANRKVKQKVAKRKIHAVLQNDETTRSNTASSPSGPVSVEAILLPRRIPLKASIRFVCFLSISFWLSRCFSSAGLPHIQAIWSLLYGSETPMPKNFRPTSADLQLSNIIATSTNEMLPPISLPAVGPLLGLFLSVAIFMGASILMPKWFTAVRVFLEYQKIPLKAAQTVLVKNPSNVKVLVHILDTQWQQEQKHSKASLTVCPLHGVENHNRQPTSNVTALQSQFSHPTQNYFEFNQCRFYLDPKNNACIDGGPNLHAASFRDLWHWISSQGDTQDQQQGAMERYGPYNRPSLAAPTLAEALAARLSSPLVVIQFVGRSISCLEEGLQSMIGLIMVFLEHFFNARQAIMAARQMASEVQTNVQDTSSCPVLVLQRNDKMANNNNDNGKWVPTTAGELVPGDIFVLSRAGEDVIMPVDALLLAGESLANEAVLTGESVPQSKIPLDFSERIQQEDDNDYLDMDTDRGSVLFAGTSLIHCTSAASPAGIQGVRFPPHNQTSGLVCLALRTGTYSSKGQLLRTLKSGAHVGAISNPQSEKDAIRLICGLSLFATLSCATLFVPREGGKPVSPFRRIIQCTRILIAGIPSDLSLALAAVARSCSYRLRQDADVICSEPGSLLTAAYVDTVVFDKTGTLTADTQSVSNLQPSLSNSTSCGVSNSFQLCQLAGCHSLIHLNVSSADQVVGDPLDQAALEHSGWKYNATDQSYYAPPAIINSETDYVHVWQIKTFPFDPSKRLSSAVVVAELADGSLQLLSLTKGSPDTLRDLYRMRKDPNLATEYDSQIKEFESQGFRSIALAWRDLTDSEWAHTLFPSGITKDGIDSARLQGSNLHRRDFEDGDLDFGGFVELDASIRTSSRRILDELSTAGLRSIMLTGDSVDAAVAVASKVGLIKSSKVVILEQHGHENELRWRRLSLRRGKRHKSKRDLSPLDLEPFDESTLKAALRREKRGKCSIAATGDALESLLGGHLGDRVKKTLARNLGQVSVIARATPSQKKDVIACLRFESGRKVMMCGDGVNDVAAMKTADVAMALLNGFGDEKNNADGRDYDDERRRKKIESLSLGNQRVKSASRQNFQRREAQERKNRKIQEAQDEVRAKVAARYGLDPNSTDFKFEFEDMKEMISASVRVTREERERAKKLKMGGGSAARILAQDRVGNHTDEELEIAEIKPGEASLVAPLSCLHPSVDGVDSALRAGVATAASALATQELIALHCLMACANLASLYRDGVRYGRHMGTVEVLLSTLVNQQGDLASCTPRPRLPRSLSERPPLSMFSPSAIARTIALAAVNLILMNVGVIYGRRLEGIGTSTDRYQLQLGHGFPKKMSHLLKAVAAAGEKKIDEQPTEGIFRRPRFRPNYETNAVFIFSILQNTLISLVNHRGKPFFRSVLESRPLCNVALCTLGLCVACIAETSPNLNNMLELKALPSRKSQIIFLGLIAANIVLNYLIDWIFRSNCAGNDDCDDGDGQLAADYEERLLREEEAMNSRFGLSALGLLSYFVVEAFLKFKPK